MDPHFNVTNHAQGRYSQGPRGRSASCLSTDAWANKMSCNRKTRCDSAIKKNAAIAHALGINLQDCLRERPRAVCSHFCLQQEKADIDEPGEPVRPGEKSFQYGKDPTGHSITKIL